ncbi:MAG TPA: ribose 5-phosphate isomerase B [Tissierellaceae bacterium]|nr:ribose 5-phosphate isomerase B [Tissierellaceae bacterium]
MKIGIGSDHGGFELKEEIKKHLKEKDIEYIDYGTNSTESVDYPDYGEAVGRAVADKEVDRGIVICGSGIGISIAANKVKGIRCALCSDSFSAKLSRAHNDANVLALGGRITGSVLALDIVDTFIEGEFEGERHLRRTEKLDKINC